MRSPRALALAERVRPILTRLYPEWRAENPEDPSVEFGREHDASTRLLGDRTGGRDHGLASRHAGRGHPPGRSRDGSEVALDLTVDGTLETHEKLFVKHCGDAFERREIRRVGATLEP